MTRCKVGQALQPDALPAEDRQLLAAWCGTGMVDGDPVPATIMAAALTDNGHPVGTTTVKDHRGKRCACYRSPQPD